MLHTPDLTLAPKTAQIGFTTYRSIDPIVLSLTSGYRYAGLREVEGSDVNPGDLFFINPSMGFAINNAVSITGGVQLRFRAKDKIDGVDLGSSRSQTSLDFGLGYATSKKMTLNFTVRSDISGNTGAQVGFNLLYKFGGLSKK